MIRPKPLVSLAAAALVLPPAPAARAAAYDGHPKVVVILVIDQFRADYLERFRTDFKGHGFRLFLDRGAYFPDCYYGYANTKTAPGHATIGTGAYTDGHGISSNEWWDLDRNKQRPVSSVEDERYALVGLTALPPPAAGNTGAAEAGTASTGTASAGTGSTGVASAGTGKAALPAAAGRPASTTGEPGASPRNLLASTVGDELRLSTGGTAEVWGVSLKDRAAILPAGAAANGAFWIDAASGRFISSTYYMLQLPAWAESFNDGAAIQTAQQAAEAAPGGSFYKQVGRTPAGNAYELAFAEALIAGEQLGKRGVTDLLTVSLSPNDILGHQVGPDSPEEHAMVDALDSDLDSFFTWLDKNVDGGLGNVWVALTADHGVAPTPAVSSALGLKGAYVDMQKLTASLNEAINQKFSPGENQPYLLAQQELPYLALNEPAFARAGINELEAEQAVQSAVDGAVAGLAKPEDRSKPADAKLPPRPQVYRTYTRLQLASGDLPRTPFGDLLGHSYSPNGGWYVMVMPVAYQMDGTTKSTGTSHYSPYSYDRHVPLGLFGAPFTPGTYHGRVEPVDIAATFASLLGVNQPSASVGHVLTQALRPAALVAYPKDALPPAKPRPVRGRHGRTAAGDAGSHQDHQELAPAPAAAPAKPAASSTRGPGAPPR